MSNADDYSTNALVLLKDIIDKALSNRTSEHITKEESSIINGDMLKNSNVLIVNGKLIKNRYGSVDDIPPSNHSMLFTASENAIVVENNEVYFNKPSRRCLEVASKLTDASNKGEKNIKIKIL